MMESIAIEYPHIGADSGSSRRRSFKGERTRAKILDAAEQLFGQSPYEEVYQRDVARLAGVLIGVLTHHYPTKPALFDAVVGRRAEELNDDRRARLEALVAPSVRDVLQAFFDPFIERAAGTDLGWQAYFSMMSRIAYSEMGMVTNKRYFTDIAKSFINVLCDAAPGKDRQITQRAFIYANDLVLGLAFQPNKYGEAIRRADNDTAAARNDIAEQYRHLWPFLEGGLKGLGI